MQVALAVPDRAHPGGGVGAGIVAREPDDVLGAAASDVDHERLVPGAAARGAEEREPSLLVAGDRLRLDVEALAQEAAELVAVLGVTDGAGGDRDDPARAVVV